VAEIVFVSSGVHPDWLFLIVDPVVVVDDVLVVVLLSHLQVQSNEPLVCEWIELHVMSLLPVVERSANLNFIVSGTSIV
jgi:hypothetical protein